MKKKNILKAISMAALVLSLSINTFAQGLTEGVNLINKEKFKAAFEFFNAKLATDAKNAEVFYRLGEISFLQGKYDDAKGYYEKGTAANADYALNYIGIAKSLLAKKDTASASGFIEKALAVPGIKANSLNFDIAEAYAVTGQNLEKAIVLVNDAMKPDKKNPTAKKNPYGYYLLGLIYQQLNNGSDAIKYFEFAIDLDPKNIKAKLGAAAVYNTIKNYDEAKGYFKKALGVDTTDPGANRQFADFFYVNAKELGKDSRDLTPYLQSLYYQERYIKYSERTTSNLYRLATLSYLTQNWSKTVEVVNQFMELDQKNYGMLRLLAYSYYDLEDYKNCTETFAKYFVVADPAKTISSDYEKNGKAYTKLGQDSVAIIYYKKCADMDSTMIDLYSVIGDIYYKQKKYADAIPFFQTKIEKAAKSTVNDYFKLAQSYYQVKDFIKADTAFSKLITVIPNEPVGYFWKARVKSNMDSTSALGLARPFYEKVIEVIPNDPVKIQKNKNLLMESYLYLGSYFIQIDDYPSSKKMWEKILEIDPANTQAQTILNRAEFKKIK